MLKYNPEKRVTAEEAFKDEWIKKYTSDSVVPKPLAVSCIKNLSKFNVCYPCIKII
jgi:hypothetical protein